MLRGSIVKVVIWGRFKPGDVNLMLTDVIRRGIKV